MFKISLNTINGIGPRKQMQDAGILGDSIRHNRSWAIVCDGIGGLPGGTEAATLCVNTFDKYFSESQARSLTSTPGDFVKLGLLPVMDAIHTHVDLNPKHLQMGCTLALAFFEQNHVCMAWCGDSRIFLFRNGKLIFKSLPHNPIFDDYRNGTVGLRKAESYKTNLITKSISASDAFPVLEIEQKTIKSRDRLLICTDGVWNALEKSDFNEIATSRNLELVATNLQTKLDKFADDNFFAHLLELK